MGFLVPAFTAFAVLAAVPILIHLYGRPRAVRRPFAALRFLLESDRKTAARRRLQELLLLVARAAAIAAVPLVLAKPYVEARSQMAGGIGQSEGAVIVLDDSRSMNVRAGRIGAGTVFARAQARAAKLVAGLGRDSEAALLLTSQGAGVPQGELTADRGQLQRALAEVKPTRRPGDTTAALKRAAAILNASPRPARRVYLVSDLAAHGFTAEAPWGEGGPELVAVDLGAGEGGRPAPNRAVVDVRVEPAPQLGPRGIAVAAVVENLGEGALREQAITLRVDGKAVATGLLDLPPRAKSEKRFFHAFSETPSKEAPAPAAEAAAPRVHEIAIELAADALPDDDQRFVRVEERRSLRALLIDGDPRTVRRDDELFYLETALRPGDRDDSRLDVRVTTLEDLLRVKLDDVDVIFAANVKAPDGERARALASYVDKGGGLFLAVGDNVDPDAWNAALGDLLPQPLATLRTVGRTLSTRDDGEIVNAAASLAADGERIARIDRVHPVLAPFEGPSAPGAGAPDVAPHGPAQALREARTGRYALLKPTPGREDERRALLRLDGGAPLLVEGKKGRGRVLLLTTTLDRDWTDLAIQPAFLPLVQQAARYLARAPLSPPEPPSLVGQPRDLPLAEGDARVEVTLPSGATRWYEEGRVRGRRALHFTDTDEPGFYHVAVSRAGGPLQPRPSLTFAVNVDPGESDLTRIEPARLAALSHPSSPAQGGAPRRRVELWHALGAALLALLLVEGVLALRR